MHSASGEQGSNHCQGVSQGGTAQNHTAVRGTYTYASSPIGFDSGTGAAAVVLDQFALAKPGASLYRLSVALWDVWAAPYRARS